MKHIVQCMMLALLAGLVASCYAQSVSGPGTEAVVASPSSSTAEPKGSAAVREDYRIGPEDLLDISVFEVPELSRTVRVSSAGEISLPLLGTLKASGRSPMELEQALAEMLKKNYVKDPQVSVFLKEYKSDPVSVMGAVKMPGLYQIQTQRNLIEVLAMAQGLSEGPQVLPGRAIIVTRKTHAVAAAPPSADPAGDSVEIPIKNLLQSGDPKWNIPIYPGDVIKVLPAGKFYVAGDVNLPGGYALTDNDSVSTIQAVAIAGGTKKTASLKNALIIRKDAAGNRVEQKIDLKQILSGKSTDAKLEANDILLIPGSVGKEAALKGLEASLQVATGVLIYHP